MHESLGLKVLAAEAVTGNMLTIRASANRKISALRFIGHFSFVNIIFFIISFFQIKRKSLKVKKVTIRYHSSAVPIFSIDIHFAR